jgi:hypothetical protein
MPSNAFTQHFVVLMKDAEELLQAHHDLKSGKPGRQWGIGALNRSAVVMALSCWEQYVESLANEVVDLQQPTIVAGTGWPVLKTTVASAAKRMNTPNAYNVKTLLCDACGIPDVTAAWAWRYHTNAADNRKALEDLVGLRGQIAHGVNPRPIVHNGQAREVVTLLANLASATDSAISNHVASALHLAKPW